MVRKKIDLEQHQALFVEIMQREIDYMSRVCAGFYPGNTELQRDLMQEVSLKLFCMLERWMRKHGYQCKLHYRSHRNYLRHYCPLPSEMDIPAPEETARFQLLYDIMDRLNNDDRAVIEAYLSDQSIRAVSELLGVTPKHASVKVFRIVKKMKKIHEQMLEE